MPLPQYLTLRNLANMTNSVVGISILTMPYCFDQCGLILGTITLALSGLLTSYSCKLLFKTADTKNSRNLEFIAYKLYGHLGKLLMEVSIILLLFGSLVTYQQTINDAAPKFVAKLIGIDHSHISHPVFMIFFTILVALPLSLSTKLEKLSNISIFAISFYLFFGVYLMWVALTKYSLEDFKEVKLWRAEGLFKCFPIFCISYSCQTVVFVVCDELREHSKENLITLMDIAMSIAFVAYSSVGIFGAVAFHNVKISGNIITMIPDSFMAQIVLFGLIICVLSGFPYMVYPCRNSINTLFFSENDENVESDYYIPEQRFNYITYALVGSIALTAMLIPNMEFVLSLTGATTGALICYIWPSLLYFAAHPKTEEKKVKAFFAVGLVMFFFCTAATLMEYNPTKSNLLPADDLELIKKNSATKTSINENRELNVNKNNNINNEQVRHEPINPIDFDNNNNKEQQATEPNVLFNKLLRAKRTATTNTTLLLNTIVELNQ